MKYLSVLGDSISSFKGSIPSRNRVYYHGNNSGVDQVEQMWWYQVCEILGYSPLVIEGWSGSPVTKGVRIPLRVPSSDDSRCLHLHDDLHEPDLILIAMSTNDYIYNAPMGEKVEIGNCKNFISAYATMITKIRNRYPNSKIACFSPFFNQKGRRDTNTFYNDLNYTEANYARNIERIAKEYDLIYIDLLSLFEVDHYYPEYSIDDPENPVHPNAKGHQRIANYIVEELQKEEKNGHV